MTMRMSMIIIRISDDTDVVRFVDQSGLLRSIMFSHGDLPLVIDRVITDDSIRMAGARDED